MPNNSSFTVSFSETALSDLHEIADYLDPLIGTERTVAHLRSIRDCCKSLSDMPLRFPAVELARFPVRRCTFEAWHIFYSITDHIAIVRIIHHARDVSAI